MNNREALLFNLIFGFCSGTIVGIAIVKFHIFGL